jgi:hypothetical protein
VWEFPRKSEFRNYQLRNSGYAPMLCPVEPVWSWLKYSRLCNYAPHNALELNGRVVAELAAIQDDQELLRSFFHASDLPLPLTLLS